VLTNLADFAITDAPLFLFHLLEWDDTVDFDLDVGEINSRWSDAEFIDSWSQLIFKQTEPGWKVVEEAPPSGVWRLYENGHCSYQRLQTHRRTVRNEEDGFFLRIARAGETIEQGDDLGILVLRGRLLGEDNKLSDRCRKWIEAIRRGFVTRPHP